MTYNKQDDPLYEDLGTPPRYRGLGAEPADWPKVAEEHANDDESSDESMLLSPDFLKQVSDNESTSPMTQKHLIEATE